MSYSFLNDFIVYWKLYHVCTWITSSREVRARDYPSTHMV